MLNFVVSQLLWFGCMMINIKLLWFHWLLINIKDHQVSSFIFSETIPKINKGTDQAYKSHNISPECNLEGVYIRYDIQLLEPYENEDLIKIYGSLKNKKLLHGTVFLYVCIA